MRTNRIVMIKEEKTTRKSLGTYFYVTNMAEYQKYTIYLCMLATGFKVYLCIKKNMKRAKSMPEDS